MLSKLREIELPKGNKNAFHVFQMYVIKLKTFKRTKFIQQLKKQGIFASVLFDPPVHLQTYYRKNYGKVFLSITEKLSKKSVSLPMFPDLTKKRNLLYGESHKRNYKIS